LKSDIRSKHNGLSNLSNQNSEVTKYYDNWAKDYDATLADWRYEAPEQIASLLSAKLSPNSTILDAGCGTGLCGSALLSTGFTKIDGVDVSQRCLEIASMTNAYRHLTVTDMQRLPLPIPDDHYDGLACVGVLTYLADTRGTLTEFNRVVRSGGFVAMTQRSDLMAERQFPSTLYNLFDEGLIEQLHISEPSPYLPENDEFSSQILVHYIGYTVV
jgi:predicted TPR repeat methyltransferase